MGSVVEAVVSRFELERPPDVSVYVGELLHALTLDTIRTVDPNLADKLHDSTGPKPFSLAFELEGNQLLMRVASTDTKIIEALMQGLPWKAASGKLSVGGQAASIQLPLNKESYGMETFLGRTLENVNAACRFDSPTSFRQRKNRQVLFPDPPVLLRSLANRWNRFMPYHIDLRSEVADNVLVSSYNLRTTTLRFSDAPIKGFLGRITYSLRRLPKPDRQLVVALLAFGEMMGVGYKTTMGMGKLTLTPGRREQ